MIKVGIVVLARFNSSRLPGKALLCIKGKPILLYIIERLEQVISKEEIIIATSTEKTDDPIAEFSKKVGVSCYRGSLENVSERFYNASLEKNWDFAARINGDNVFVDIKLLERMIQVARTDKYNFISNVKKRTYPKGMSIEIVKLSYYSNFIITINNSSNYREHVTMILYENSDSTHHYFVNEELPAAAGIQLALDTVQDLERTQRIIYRFEKPHWNYNLTEIFNLINN